MRRKVVRMDLLHAVAAKRFGLGICPSKPVPDDAAGWLKDQLVAPDPARFALPSTWECMASWREDTQHPMPKGQPTRVSSILAEEKRAQLAWAAQTLAPFRERLVWFWSNHFTVSLTRLECIPVAGAFVREAIRPYVTGRFEDMLLAVMRHPAMLMYLDNAASVGPNSVVGQRGDEGLNENLARECLELHTVSLDAGYTQTDVTNFAKIITGWTVDYGADRPGFLFDADSHEPGEIAVMGQVFPPGEEGGVAALRWLAHHPSTCRFLATKLVRHFVADDPPPAIVARIAGVLAHTNGDLGAAASALVDTPEAWKPLTKLRDPQDYAIAVVRVLDFTPERMPDLDMAMANLGMPLWTAPLPNGWPDTAADWAGPEAMLRRTEWANYVAGLVTGSDPLELSAEALGPLLSAETLRQIMNAGSRRAAHVLLFASPEFLRR